MNAVNITLEALQFADGIKDQYFDPTKKNLASAPHEIENILPPSNEPTSRFLELLSSKGYETCVTKLANYLKIPLDQVYANYPDMYAFTGLIMESLNQVMAVEKQHKQHLEQLAIKTVLDLPEFSLFKDFYDQGILKLDVELGAGELENSISADEIENDQENIIAELEPEIEADPEKKLKRAFHNFITQGNALHKSFLFNMVTDELSKIDNSLPVKYGLVMATTHVLYYGTPYVSDPVSKGAMALGSEEVDGDSIKIRGIIFPVLVHEIVKGLFDYLGQDISPETHGNETIEDEYMQLMAGPALFQKLYALVPQNKIKLFPIIYRLLLKRNANDIKAVIAGGEEGKRIIQFIVMAAEQKHQQQQEQDDMNQFDEPNFDFGAEDGEFGGEGEEWKNN